MHSNSMMHLDLKPDNILAFEDNIIKIGDLGTVKFFKSSIRVLKEKAGTLAYMAPEVRKTNNYSYRADIYSLGIIFYNILNQGFFDNEEY
jgi:serine/threonine protein kinase